MAGDYRRVEVERETRAFHDEEPEREFWEQYTRAYHAQQPSSVTCVDFSAAAPHDLAATASARVAVLDGRTLEPRHALARFRAQAFSGRFRGDGRMLCAGGEDGVVRAFDAASRAELRALRGHRGPVRAVRFARDLVHVVSGGDDGALREWALATAECSARVAAAHGDVIRDVAPSPAADGVWASASYDGTARVWDVRAAAPQVATLAHGAPVEALLWLPGGSALATCGGNRVRVWDVLAGRVLAELANHQKTVTALALGCDGSRLLTGGADHLVKVLDVQSFRVLHTFCHHAPVISLAVSPDSSRIAIGAVDGDLCVLTRQQQQSQQSQQSQDAADDALVRRAPGTVRYFLRSEPDVRTVQAKQQQQQQQQQQKKQKQQQSSRMARHDVLLRKFKYAAALDAALATNTPAVVVGTLRELMHRGGLQVALKGRDETTLEPLLVFLVNCITVPQFSPLLVPVCNAVVSMYASALGRSMRIDELFFKLQTRLHRELELQGQLLRLMGALDLLVAASDPAAPPSASATPVVVDAAPQQQQQQQQ